MQNVNKTFRDDTPIIPSEEKIIDTVNRSIEVFCLKEEEKVLAYREFLWTQFRIIQKRWWLLQILLLIGVGMVLSSNQEEFFIQRGLSITSVLFVILIIPELWKNKSNQCMEIESASYYSLRQIYSTRIFLFGLVDSILLTVFCFFLHGKLHITLIFLLSQFFFPAVVTACICFGLLCNKNNVSETISIILCIMWSIVWWLITANEKIYSNIKFPMWILLTGIALLILGNMIHKTLYYYTQYWEGCPNGIKNDKFD